jgi:predicted O-methyltransferase YrrM
MMGTTLGKGRSAVGARALIGKRLEATLGKERTDLVRRVERRTRQQLADRLAPRPVAAARPKPAAPAPAQPSAPAAPARPLGEPNDRQGGWIASDPFVPHPEPKMTRHDLLRGLHEVLSPRTYLEIGVNAGSSLTLSRAKSIGIDPEFTVRHPLHCDLALVKAKSDEFFTRPDALAHFDGVPVDLAFIDGMHLSEFAFRDFINVERHLAPAGVTVFDDTLPRNALEAARVRRTGAWAGDVYKAVEIIARRRPDLLVVLINTWPTGTAIVVGGDPASNVLQDAYPSEVPYLQAPDPQSPPQAYMSRTAAVDPADLLASGAWPLLVAARESGDAALIEQAKEILLSIPTIGSMAAPVGHG